jgi:hypothetical protein
MKIAPPFSQTARLKNHSRETYEARSELVMRYAAACACTLIAIAAAQLYIQTSFALLLAGVTLLGLPISLYLRRTNLHLFGSEIPRFVINSTIVVLSGFACLYFLVTTQADLLASGFSRAALLSHSTTDSMAILMSMFLIFAALRSLAIINDKDAVLSAVPSFSVLLLLIVVHRGPAVVAYFLLWAMMAAILFTLDHRQEARQSVVAIVPSQEPGADVKLSARGLTTVMSFSLICAIGISYWLSSRNPEDRGLVEGWILGMAGRMTQLALNLPDVSVNSGPERQIDFTSGPALPTRTELWAVRATLLPENTAIQPEYWRMFSLSQYDGSTWSQSGGAGKSIPLESIGEQQWRPLFRERGNNHISADTRENSARPTTSPDNNAGNNNGNNNRRWPRPAPGIGSTPNAGDGRERSFERRIPRSLMGYNITENLRDGTKPQSFGTDRQWVQQRLDPRASNIGFVPILPTAEFALIIADKPPDSIGAQDSGGVDARVLETGQRFVAFSRVSSGQRYGVDTKDGGPPMQKTPSAKSDVTLSASARQANLALPEGLRAPNARVRLLAQQTLRNLPENASDYARARRLALMVQQRGIYTLRPPAIPEGADAADYFLFQSRRGYCTYFAGALTVLCRSAGIPARVVSGFVNPEWVEGGSVGILREANAHAWTEVWVDGWGWANLDATPLENRGNNAPGWWENWADLIGAVLDGGRRWADSHRALVALGALLLAALLAALAIQRGLAVPLLARLQNLAPERMRFNQSQARRLITKSYQRAAKKLARRFRRRLPWETPAEWLEAAEVALAFENPQPLRELTHLYQQAEYSPRAISGEDGAAALQAMQRISWRVRREE